MARFCCLLALVLLASCWQDLHGLQDPADPPDATPGLEVDGGNPEPGPDSGQPQPEPDAGAPDVGRPAGPDAALVDLGACSASPSPARVGQAVTITCPAQASMSGPTGWSMDGPTGIDGGFTATAGGDAGTGTFTLWSVPRNFPDSTVKVHARFKGASGEGVATAALPVLGNLWVAKGGAEPAITAFTTSPDYAKWGNDLVDVIGSTEFDASPRALGLTNAGDLLVAQANTTPLKPPVFVVSRTTLQRVDSIVFDATDPGGLVLFDQGKYVSPRAVIQTSDGNIWVTGGPVPVVFGPDGKFKFRPAAPTKPSGNTLGLAQLANGGQVVVSVGTLKIGRYSLDGSSYDEIEPLKGGDGYSEIQAICPLAEGGVVLSLHRYVAGTSGGMLAQLDASWSFVRETPQGDWTYQEVHSHLIRVGDEFVATPELDAVQGSYLYRYGPDLKKLPNIGSGYLSQHYSGVVRLK